jgi:hypothetical protein
MAQTAAHSIVLDPGADVRRSDAVSKSTQGATLDGVTGIGGISVLTNPALAHLFNPTPFDAQAAQVKVAIDSKVQQLATETPTLVTRGVELVNHLGDAERPVINLPGWCERKTLSWSDIEQLRAQDAAELKKVAECITLRLSIPCDSATALALLVERMKTLLRESVLFGIAQEEALTIRYEIGSRERRIGVSLLRFIPGEKAIDAALRDRLAEAEQRKQCHASLHGGAYTVCPQRAGVSVMRGRLDSLWYYLPSNTSQEGGRAPQAQRINAHSIALAQLGVFQKGDCDWDQHYPTSSLQFFRDHVEPYLTVSGTGSK